MKRVPKKKKRNIKKKRGERERNKKEEKRTLKVSSKRRTEGMDTWRPTELHYTGTRVMGAFSLEYKFLSIDSNRHNPLCRGCCLLSTAR
jgi:hypothetical protein